MPGPAAAVGRKVAAEIGKRLTRLMIRRSGSRVVGHLNKNDRVWQKAFAHIRMHFSTQAGAGKASHAVFDRAYRSESAVKLLIRQAATRPSRTPVVSKATIDGIAQGKPVVIIERQFKQVIGKDHAGKSAQILRLVVDYTGRPLTAFPVSSFFSRGAAAAATVSGALILATVETAYAAEAEANQKRTKDACAPHGIVEWILDILLSPSCIAPDPPSGEFVEKRAQDVIKQVQQHAGALDDETKHNIRWDVYRIWGRHYPESE